MPELNTAPADAALTGAEKLLTLAFENVTVQQVADANESKASDIASATTTDIGAATAPFVHVTGTTTITGLGTVQAGTRRIVVFDGALTLTHNASSLILPTGSNITTSAGDVAVFVSEGSGNWRCVGYTRADGTPLAGGGSSAGASIGVQYDADLGSTADSDPGAGLMKWNNATQASATELYLDDTTDDGVSLTGFWSALAAGGFAYLQHATDQDTWQIWEITAVTDASGYVKLAVTLLAKGDDFADDDPMLVTLQQGPGTPSGADRSTLTALSIASGVVDIDCSLGDFFTLSLTANVTSITFSNLPASGHACSLAVQIRQDGTGSRTVALPSSFKATGGSDTTVQSAANAYTLLTITTFDQGTRWAYAMQEVAA